MGNLLLVTTGCEMLVSPDRSRIGEGQGASDGQGGDGQGGSGGSGGKGGDGQGGSGGSGGEGGDGQGGAGGCGSPSDCPAPADECVVATCIDRVCGTEDAAADTPVAVQTPGDCRERRCDGSGAVVDAPEDTDVPPDDNNECTDDLCSAGDVVHTPRVAGTLCTQGGAVCNDAGACVACVTAADCPGDDTECAARTCVANACDFAFTAAGTPIATQEPGDCQLSVCDGAGAETSEPANADLPADANDCTDDVCTAGVPSNPPIVAGEVCARPDGGLCDGAGACVECVVNDDCPTQVCLANVCQAPTCTDGVLNGDEAGIDCGGTDCAPCVAPGVVTSVSYPVIALGGQLRLVGTGFTGATAVNVGGVAQAFTVDSDTQITVAALADATPIGARGVTVSTPGATSVPFALTVIRLQISEVDSDTPTTPVNDDHEFVEISTGAPNVSLAGYTIVFWNGGTDLSYFALGLSATTDGNGLLLVGNSGVSPAPALTFGTNGLQNGADAVGLYQALPAVLPTDTPVTAAGLIDVLVYDTNDADDAVLLDTLISSDLAAPQRVQVDEGANPASETQSVQRCGDGRRDGRRFAAAASTPGMVNTVSCP